MANIEDTEAYIQASLSGSEWANIYKISGIEGFGFIKLFQAEPPESKKLQFAGLNISCSDAHNFLWISSNYKNTSLKKKAKIKIHFHGEESLEKIFLMGKSSLDKVPRNCFSLSNSEVRMFMEKYLRSIEFDNGIVAVLTRCEQYDNRLEGQHLLQIMAKRIIAAKLIIISNAQKRK